MLVFYYLLILFSLIIEEHGHDHHHPHPSDPKDLPSTIPSMNSLRHSFAVNSTTHHMPPPLSTAQVIPEVDSSYLYEMSQNIALKDTINEVQNSEDQLIEDYDAIALYIQVIPNNLFLFIT